MLLTAARYADGSGAPAQEFFASEQYGHYGLVPLGVALLLATFIRRVSRARPTA